MKFVFLICVLFGLVGCCTPKAEPFPNVKCYLINPPEKTSEVEFFDFER